MSDQGSWRMPFGSKCPRGQFVFGVQTFAALTLIIVSLVNLSVPGLCDSTEERGYWKIALSGTIGYLFPNPSLTSASNKS